MLDAVNITTERETEMPWNADNFKKHNRKLNGKALRGAAAAATAALKSGKDEGTAVRIGNAVGNKLNKKSATKPGS